MLLQHAMPRQHAPPLHHGPLHHATPRMQIGGPPLFVLIYFTRETFVHETLYGGAEMASVGRTAVRTSTLAQAMALGRNLEAASPGIRYSVFKLSDGEMQLKSSFPKRVNAEGARVKFRRRKPRTGGADDALLGVGGMGDDVWRELLERDGWGSLDDAWSAFRKELELGRGLDVVDERGEKLDLGGDYDDDEDGVYD